jgi:hypothetical protein
MKTHPSKLKRVDDGLLELRFVRQKLFLPVTEASL